MPKKEKAATAREAALRALVRVEKDGAYLNLALPSLLRELSAEDKALARQLAAGVIERLNTLDWALSLYLRRDLSALTPWIRNLLRLGAYQLIYLDRVPGYAAVNETVRLARRYGHRGVAGMVNAVLRRLAENASSLPWPEMHEDPAGYLALKESYPRWLVARYIERLGFDEAEKWCRAGGEKPSISLRPNLLQISAENLAARLATEGFSVTESPLVPGMLRLVSGGSPATAPSYQEGLFTIQGESSALAAPLLKPRAGETIIDLCSAPGGKTTHLAELMGDRGRIIAVDLHRSRLQLVEKAALRLGHRSIETLQSDGRMIGGADLNLSSAQAVLVDAPCSGLGVIRRLPEIKWRRREDELTAFQSLQLALLNAAAGMLSPGGRLLYTVCSTEPEETTAAFENFSCARRDFSPEPVTPLLPTALKQPVDNETHFTLFPHHQGLDGFFFALWCKRPTI